MEQNYEQKMLREIEQTPYENAIIVSGKPECIPDILLLIESLQLNLSSSYQIIYFHYQYSDEQLNIIKSLYPNILLFDIEELMPDINFLKSIELLCNNYFGPPIAIKFYCFKLLTYFDHIIYLDRDTYVIRDFTEILNQLIAQNFEFAALPHHDAMFLSCKSQIEAGIDFIKEFNAISPSSWHPKTTLINGGVLFLSSSILKKINFDRLSSTIVDICQFQTNFSFACTDEDILTYIINTNDIQFISLPDSCNFVFGFNSLQNFPTCKTQEKSNTDEEKIYIIHMCSSDKRSPFVSSVFPEIEFGTSSLLTKLKQLNIKTVSCQELIENLITNSITQNRRNRIKHLMCLRNNLFYRNFSYDIFKYLTSSKYFYTEKIQNDIFFFLFIYDVNQATRFFIAPEFFDLNFIEVTFRIYILHASHSRNAYLHSFNKSKFKSDFINSFNRTSVEYEDKFIYLRYHIPKEEFITSLRKLEILFEKHSDYLYLYLF